MPTELFAHLLAPDTLQTAWERVRKGGKAPGIDGVTLPRFAFHLDRELDALSHELRTGQYQPWPARQIALPKSDGGLRRIGIQAVRDRVVQRALLTFLQPRIEPRLEDCSYAFRPHRSIRTALAQLEQWRQRGYPWTARADVALCFDSLDRSLLAQALVPVVPEPDVQDLIRLWLNAGQVEEDGWSESETGVMTGDVLSPMLSNLYLDAFDEAVTGRGYPLVRYADDFVILGRSEADARSGLDCAAEALSDLRLRINARKSAVGTFLQGFTYLGAAIVGGLQLPLVRIERPGRPPRFTFGYETPRPRRTLPPSTSPSEQPPLAATRRALRDRMVALLRAERHGQALPTLAEALLHAWQEAGALPSPPPPPEPEGWQSVYLI